jgi:hypothetical protein
MNRSSEEPDQEQIEIDEWDFRENIQGVASASSSMSAA